MPWAKQPYEPRRKGNQSLISLLSIHIPSIRFESSRHLLAIIRKLTSTSFAAAAAAGTSYPFIGDRLTPISRLLPLRTLTLN